MTTIAKATTTRSGLAAAKLYPVNSNGSLQGSGPIIHCNFNPSKYSLSITNNFSTKGKDDGENLSMESDQSSAQGRELSLGELWFDTSNDPKDDVTEVTSLLMELAQMKDAEWQPEAPPEGGAEKDAPSPELKRPPAKVAFEWGAFKFLGVIKSLTVDYVLFRMDGTPIRAKVDIKLTEIKQGEFENVDPSADSGPTERTRQVTAGDRLDLIAAESYGDASRWTTIAARNGIEDPFSLKPGSTIVLPSY